MEVANSIHATPGSLREWASAQTFWGVPEDCKKCILARWFSSVIPEVDAVSCDSEEIVVYSGGYFAYYASPTPFEDYIMGEFDKLADYPYDITLEMIEDVISRAEMKAAR